MPFGRSRPPTICIYEANTTDWHGNGLCILQPSSCTVSEIADGDFSLPLVRNNADFYLLDNDGPPDSEYEIVYGKNMTGISWCKSTDGVVTRIVPIGKDADGRRMPLPEQWIDSPHIGEYPMIHTGTLTVSNAKEVVVEESGDEGSEDIPASDVEPFTIEQCYELMRQAAADYWYGTCVCKASNSVLSSKTRQYPDHYCSNGCPDKSRRDVLLLQEPGHGLGYD